MTEQKFVDAVYQNQERLKLRAAEFQKKWLDDVNVREALRSREHYFNQVKDLMMCLCDACATYRGVAHCELCGDCSLKMTEHLIRLGVSRSNFIVTEAFDELTRRLKENVTGKNVDYFSEVKSYMLQIENDYIKRCYPGFVEKECKSV